jgi:hypothetical protein
VAGAGDEGAIVEAAVGAEIGDELSVIRSGKSSYFDEWVRSAWRRIYAGWAIGRAARGLLTSGRSHLVAPAMRLR